MEIEEVAAKTPEAIYQRDHRSGRRLRRLAGAQAGLRAGPQAHADQPGRRLLSEPLQGLHRDRRLADRDQSLHHHQGRQALRARRQDQLRRQRALPPRRHQGAARRRRRGPARSRGQQVRAQLHQARRLHRLHGQRRGPGHGHHGHHPVRRRQPGQLPRRGRRRDPGTDRARLRDPALATRT